MMTQVEAENHNPDTFRAAVMAELVCHGIAEVTITFDGSGDEGQIESIGCTKLDGTEGSLDFAVNIPGKVISAGARVWNSQSRQYVTEPSDRSLTMAEVLDEWSYELLDQTGVDWVNNEGGCGEIIITPAANSIRCDMHARFIDTVSSHHEL
jgi:hypothetical protein